MAKTVAEWKKVITDQFISNEQVILAYNLQAGKTFEEEFSKASVESILCYSVAYCAWVLEQLQELFRKDTEEYIAKMRPHSQRWYAEKALAFHL